MPDVDGSTPLGSALGSYLQVRGEPPPTADELEQDLASLGLGLEQKRTLARLVLAYLTAEREQSEALAALTEEEKRLVSFEPEAVAAWFGRHEEASWRDLEADIARLLEKVDLGRSVAAAELLARAVHDARASLGPFSADPPATIGPAWARVHELVDQVGFAPPRAHDDGMDLQTSVRLLADVLHVEAPQVPALPVPVDRALARIVAAHAAGGRAGNPAWHAHWVLDAVEQALPVLEGWQAPPTVAAASSSSNVPKCLPAPPSVSPTSTPTPPPIPPPPQPDLTLPLVVPIPGVEPNCPDNPWLLLLAGTGQDVHDEPALIRIDLGGNDRYVTEVAGPGLVTTSEGGSPSVIIGSIHLDLGGNDEYETPTMDYTQASTFGGFSLLLDVAGADEYQAGRYSQGAACCRSGAGLGGLAGPGGIGLLLDLAGDDAYSGDEFSQGFAESGVLTVSAASGRGPAGVGGFLVDLDGSDHYRFATQAVAAACPSDRGLPDAFLDRTVAALWDIQGTDHYESRVNAVNPNLEGAIFQNQGVGHCSEPNTAAETALGLFLDSRGDDQYTILSALTGGPVDASASMNNQRRTRTEPSTGAFGGIGVFLDTEGTDLVLTDEDGDGAATLLEQSAGTDPNDPTSRPSEPLSGADPTAGGAWLLAPRPARNVPTSGFFLPGLAILGPGNSSLTEPVDFLVDLGGDDLFLSPGLGGVRPFERRTATGLVPQPWFVSLVLDVGSGDDVFAPPVRLLTETGVERQVQLLEAGTSLGGAMTGIALLADDGGKNLFDAAVRVDATVQQFGEQSFLSDAHAMGLTQGSGANAGVGMLVTWDAQNEFRSLAQASATVVGGKNQNPRATTFGLSQGAGYYGVGLLLSFGLGEDQARAQSEASTNPDFGSSRYELSLSQGAARAGVGVLVDGGGRGRFEVDAPAGQGTGWTLTNQANEPAKWAITGGPQSTLPVSAIGAFLAGPGNTTYVATGWAQGVGVGISSEPADAAGQTIASHLQNRGTSHPTFTTTNGRGAPAAGFLIDLGGQDAYAMEAGSYASQGSGVLGGLGVLVDGAGDDLYQAPGGRLVQGSAHLGQGLLLEMSGHDRYLAETESQGFATDDPALLMHLAACVGQPGSFANFGMDVFCTKEFIIQGINTNPAPNLAYGTYQARTFFLAQFPTLSLLLDRHGSDAFRAQATSQGVAEGHLQYVMEAGACKSPEVRTPTTTVPLAPFLKPCADRFYPGTTPGANAAPRPPSATDTSTPPQDAFLLGLFVDASHPDRYEPPHLGAKQPLVPGQVPPADANDWVWRQVLHPTANLNETKLPKDALQGAPTAGPVNPEAADNPGRLLPSASLPQPVLGLGVDDGELSEASSLVLHEVLDQLNPARIELTVATDPSGTPLPAGMAAEGLLYLVAEITLPPAADPSLIGRLDFLVDNEFLGLSQRDPGAPDALRFVLPWDTAAFDARGRSLVPDGDHRVQASLYAADHGSIESPPTIVPVNNPPTLRGQWTGMRLGDGRLAMSPALGHSIRINLSISPDLEVPPGENLPSPTDEPGAFLEIVADGPTRHVVFPRTYLPAGPRQVAFDGRCGPTPCPDGQYGLRIQATDSRGGSTQLDETVHIDGTSPTSRLEMPPVAGLAHLVGSQTLRVQYSFDDDHGVPGSGVGVQDVDLLRMHPNGLLQRVGGGTGGSSDIADGVATGATLRFLTTAVDLLGNRESPCLTNPTPEAPPCGRAKVAAAAANLIPPEQGPRSVTVDFSAPEIVALESTHDFVSPGRTPVAFRAVVREEGSGLRQVAIRLLNRTFPMTPEGEDVYSYTGWAEQNRHAPANETPFVFNVLAVDAADNLVSRSGSGTLDALAPRVEVRQTTYEDADGNSRPAGRGGSLAVLRLGVQDAAVARVEALVSAIDPARTTQACGSDTTTLDLEDWNCKLALPPSIGDGDYAVPVRVVDAAGNEYTAPANVLVSDTLLPITDVNVTGIGHDFVTLRWRTPLPGTSQVRFGKTSELGRETPLNTTYSTLHEVKVQGLQPSTTYFLQVLSQNEGGRENQSAVLAAATSSALVLSFPNLTANQVLAGLQDVRILVSALSGEGGARVSLYARREDGSGVVQPVGTQTDALGAVRFLVNTTLFGDGALRFFVEADRAGDFAELESPLLVVDNAPPLLLPEKPLPEGRIHASRPLLSVLVAESPGLVALDPNLVRVYSGGTRLGAAVDRWEPGTPQSRLRVRLPNDLLPGRHQLLLALPDAAGNVGTLELPLELVDGMQPQVDLETTYSPGPLDARPGGRVDFLLEAAADLGLSGLRLEIEALGVVPLQRKGEGWAASMQVPANASAGAKRLVLKATDGWSQAFEASLGELRIDPRPPKPGIAALPQGPSSIRLTAEADEPIRLRVQGTSIAWTERAFSHHHSVLLQGLTPGALQRLNVTATDGAGNSVEATIAVQLPPDATAPEAVPRLEVDPGTGGAPRLRWPAAKDDSGIREYEVLRTSRATNDKEASFRVASSPFEDAQAPEGVPLEYAVRAVDLAGKYGPTRTAQFLRPPTAPQLQANVTPSQGSTTTLFRLLVLYSHPSGAPPEQVVATVSGVRYPLTPVQGSSDCHQGCLFETALRLAASTQWGSPPILVESTWRGTVTNTTLEGPVVTDAAFAFEAGESHSVGLPYGLIAAAVLTALAHRRRRP